MKITSQDKFNVVFLLGMSPLSRSSVNIKAKISGLWFLTSQIHQNLIYVP